MRTFCIFYKSKEGFTVEYWVQASTISAARVIFREAFLRGDLDYETDGKILKITERD